MGRMVRLKGGGGVFYMGFICKKWLQSITITIIYHGKDNQGNCGLSAPP